MTFRKGTLGALGVVAVAAVPLFAPAKASAAECNTDGPITIAEMTWLSASTLAYVAERVLEGYGCEVEIVPGDTVPTATSMLTKAEPDIAPEMWTSTLGDVWERILATGKVYKAADSFDGGGVEHIWVPDYFAEAHPEIKSVEDLKDNWQLFAEASDPDQGRFYGCPPGWACEITTTQLFKALGLDETFEYFSPGSGANLQASIARKVARKEPIVAYYWGPTAVIGRYNLVPLDMPPYDADAYSCLSNPECPDPTVTAFKPSEVVVAVTNRVKDEAPEAAAALSKMTLPREVILDVLAWGDEQSASPEDTAIHFFKTYEDLWTQWVPQEVATNIKASLD